MNNTNIEFWTVHLIQGSTSLDNDKDTKRICRLSISENFAELLYFGETFNSRAEHSSHPMMEVVAGFRLSVVVSNDFSKISTFRFVLLA